MYKLIISIFVIPTIGIAQCSLDRLTLSTHTDGGFEEYQLKNEESGIIKKLDTSKYIASLTVHHATYFAVLSMKGEKNWKAIDVNENILFDVYNVIPTEPTPDYLINDRIRMIDKNNKIGFANRCGDIVIRPQFDFATHFNNGYAIVSKKCKVYYVKTEQNSTFVYPEIKCKQYGYIDRIGNVLKLGKYTYDEIKKEIDWKEIDAY